MGGPARSSSSPARARAGATCSLRSATSRRASRGPTRPGVMNVAWCCSPAPARSNTSRRTASVEWRHSGRGAMSSPAIHTRIYLPPHTRIQVIADEPTELADGRAPARTRSSGAGHCPGRLRLRDPRRRQRDPSDRGHHAAVVSRRSPARVRGVHAGRQLVELSAAQARRRPAAGRGQARRNLLLPLRRSRRLRVSAALRRSATTGR